MVSELIARKHKADALPSAVREKYNDEYVALCMDLIEAMANDVNEYFTRFMKALENNDIEAMYGIWKEAFGKDKHNG